MDISNDQMENYVVFSASQQQQQRRAQKSRNGQQQSRNNLIRESDLENNNGVELDGISENSSPHQVQYYDNSTKVVVEHSNMESTFQMTKGNPFASKGARVVHSPIQTMRPNRGNVVHSPIQNVAPSRVVHTPIDTSRTAKDSLQTERNGINNQVVKNSDSNNMASGRKSSHNVAFNEGVQEGIGGQPHQDVVDSVSVRVDKMGAIPKQYDNFFADNGPNGHVKQLESPLVLPSPACVYSALTNIH